MNRKIIKLVAIGVGAALVGFAVLVTGLSYVTAAGDRTRFGVRVMEKSGLQNYLNRRAQERARKND